ncbi:DUF6259 domain-containing protein [Candidatus Hydrogenedentota bacterium]
MKCECRVAMATLFLYAALIVHQPVFAGEGDGNMKLDTPFLTITFDEESLGGVASVSAYDGSIELCAEKAEAPTLFAVQIEEKGRMHTFTNLDAQDFSFEKEELGVGQCLTLKYRDLGGADIDATATIAIDEDTGVSRWRIEVDNRADSTLVNVNYPWIQGYKGLSGSPDTDFVVVPMGEGKLYKNPLWALLNEKAQLGLWYPGNHSMQFTALYARNGKGFYLGSEDTKGLSKLVLPQKTKVSKTSLTTGVEFKLAEKPGEGFKTDFDVVLAPFKGNWHDAAEIYRKWASKQWWCEKKWAERNDIPSWFRDVWPIITIENYATTGGTEPEHLRHTMPQIAEWEKKYQDALGPCIFFWSGWERGGAWVSPDLFPPVEGEKPFDKAVRETKEMGCRLEAYFSTVLYIVKHGETIARIENEGLSHAIQGKDGKRKRFTNWWGPSTKMCLATDWWQGVLKDTVVSLTKRGFDVVQLDMFPISSPEPCWDAAHGHPVGHGSWSFEVGREVIQSCRAAGRKANPELVISIEQPCELYIPYIDTHLSRDDWRDLVAPAKRAGHTDIPLFSYVYHEYITTQGYEWSMIPLPSMAGTVATQFVRGKLPTAFEGWGSWDPKWEAPSDKDRDRNRERALKLLKKTRDATAGYAKSIVLGSKMLKTPSCKFTTPQGEYALDWNSIDPAVGAFECQDGSVGLLVVNTGEAGTLQVRLDALLPETKAWDMAVFRDGNKETLSGGSNGLEIDVATDEVLVVLYNKKI